MKNKIIYVNASELKGLLVIILAKIYKKNIDVLSAMCPPSALEVVKQIKERGLVAIIFDYDHCLCKKTIEEIAKEKTGIKIILLSREQKCWDCQIEPNRKIVRTLKEAYDSIPR